MNIFLAETDDQIERCYPVMAELRPHVAPGEFVAQVGRQQKDGHYQLAGLEDHAGIVQAAAGFRILENLPWRRFLYVDDLVTAGGVRSRGHGQKLFDWLLARARAHGCAELHLDSGVQRFDAHRFYLRNRMAITAHHFALKLA